MINSLDQLYNDTLQQTVKELAQANRDLEAIRQELATRNLAHAAYAEAINQFEATELQAEPAPKSPHEKVVIRWLTGINEECRRAEVLVPDSWDSARIFAMGDQQYGHKTCDVKRLLKDIAWTQKDPHTLAVLLGDGPDAATRHGKGSPVENSVRPLRQVEDFVEIHKPIAGQIVGIVGGNHEARIDKALDEPGAAVRLIAKGLSTEDHRIPYSSGILLLDVYWKGHLWTFTLFHGAGAAQTAGAKIQRLQRNILLTDSLITLSGHLHDEAKTSRRFAKRQKDGGIKIVKQTSLQCGSYLNWLGSYAESAGMLPTGPDMIVIELHEDGNYTDRFKGEGEPQ